MENSRPGRGSGAFPDFQERKQTYTHGGQGKILIRDLVDDLPGKLFVVENDRRQLRIKLFADRQPVASADRHIFRNADAAFQEGAVDAARHFVIRKDRIEFHVPLQQGFHRVCRRRCRKVRIADQTFVRLNSGAGQTVTVACLDFPGEEVFFRP